MLAARYLGPNRLEPLHVPKPELAEGEALIRVEACGFCGSDLGIVAGVHPRAREPLTLGHEFCGVIEETRGAGSDLKPGDRVTAIPLISCGHCFVCRNGSSHVCSTLRLYGIDADGAMAEYVRVPLASLVRIPSGMSPLVGALIEPLAVAVHGVSFAPADHVSTTIVLGAGPIGLLTALVATARGYGNVVISDILPFRTEFALRFGLNAVRAGTELKEMVTQTTAGEGADLLFECVGEASTAIAMTDLLRPRGTIVNLGVFKKPVEVNMQAVNFKELTLRGSRVYTRQDFETAIALAASLPIGQIVTHCFPLSEVQTAFDQFRKRDGVCKVLILPKEIED